MRKPIKAWAVLCASGRFHRRDHERHRLFLTEERAVQRQRYADLGNFRTDCGPHQVVLLRGSVRKGR